MNAGRVAAAALLAFALAASLSRPAAVRAQAEDERVLPGCGICYPGGYDPNTVGEIRGRVAVVAVPDSGPVRLEVAGDRDRWVVLAAPAWFWKQSGLTLQPGDSVAVRGSKSLGADGELYVVAREIRTANGATVCLRDGRGVPLWRGARGDRGPAAGPDPGAGRCNAR
jgi:hypothetical protein